MNERTSPQTPDDDWLESLLRAHSREQDYVADDGFTARVSAALPAAAGPPAWRRPALAALWGIAGVGLVAALPGTAAQLAYSALDLIAGHRFSLTDAFAALLIMAAASWAGSLYALRQE